MAGINGNFASGLQSGLDRGLRAIFSGQDAFNSAQMKGSLMGAQTAKFATDAAETGRMSSLRQNESFLSGLAAMYGPEVAAAFRAGGGADKFGDNAMTAQKYRFNDQVLGNIGNPGTDQAKINQGTSLLAGKAYTPYSAVGNTGVVLDQGTGNMNLANRELFGVHSDGTAAGRSQVVDTPQGVQIVNTRTGMATPAISGGAPLMGQKAFDADQEHRKNEKARSQARLSFNDASASLDRLAFAAQELANDPAIWRITGLPGTMPNLPGGDAANAQAKLTNLKSQVGFAVLQAMRDASKTGGALGQVSDKENEMLQNNLAALDASQSPEEFQRQLLRIVEYANGVKSRLADAYSIQFGNVPGQGDGTTPAGTTDQPQRSVVRRGNMNGRAVVQYSDGSIEFAE